MSRKHLIFLSCSHTPPCICVTKRDPPPAHKSIVNTKMGEAQDAVFRSMKGQVQTYVACLLQGIATPEMGSNLLDA